LSTAREYSRKTAKQTCGSRLGLQQKQGKLNENRTSNGGQKKNEVFSASVNCQNSLQIGFQMRFLDTFSKMHLQ